MEHSIDINDMPNYHASDINNISTCCLALIAIILLILWFVLIIMGALCSLSGEYESKECQSASNIFSLYRIALGMGILV